jgi:hypothetical protein
VAVLLAATDEGSGDGVQRRGGGGCGVSQLGSTTLVLQLLLAAETVMGVTACRAMAIAVQWLLHAAVLCGGVDALRLVV